MGIDVGTSTMGLVAIVAAIVSLLWQVAIVILGVVIAWRWLHRPGCLANQPRPRDKTAYEVLEDRFARSEIDAAEFEERSIVLRRGRS